LETPLVDVLLACIEQRLASFPALIWKNEVAATVVMAAGGYPGEYAKGKVITGLTEATANSAMVFHAGTQLRDGQIISDGGRVLNVVATGSNFATALQRVYAAVEKIQFPEGYYRRDIGHRILAKEGL
jgi:phosphoribosylamine---glycine ligase